VAIVVVALVMVLAMGSGSLASAVTARATVTGPAGVVASSQLTGIACPTSTTCFAVGFLSVSSSGMDKTLIERWNGVRWSVVASPNPAGAKFSRLFGVGCQSASSCFAVGNQYFPTSRTGKTLIERWNGKAWSIVTSPNPAAGWADPQLNGVSCTATTCLAVGLVLFTSSNCCKTFVQRWNGNAWSTVPTPNLAGSSYSRLDAVSCTATLVCVAVGMFAANGRPKTLVERWNGTTLSVVASPSHPILGAGDALVSVSCPSATSCVAAGNYLLGDVGRPATLVERWNGTQWSMVTSRDPNRSYAELKGISCATTTNCMAAGDSFAPTAPPPYGFVGSKALIERWNGTAWSIIAGPNAGTYTSLSAVKCVNATTCFAAGHGSAASGAWNALIERWNGTTWKVVVNANP
jgi:hypothetical protein